jgi:hypothetical protein
MSAIIVLGCIFWAVIYFGKAMQQKNLRQDNPDAWLRLQEMEHERKKMKHEAISKGVGAGSVLLRLLINKK